MDLLETTLAEMDGGRVLDVATQQGRFVQVMMEGLRSYTEIVGIDVTEPAIEAARSAIEAANVSFSVMNAENLEFNDESFDTVGISASLHHMADIPRVLDEMNRVLRPGGRFIVMEMFRPPETEPEVTSMYLHQWAAEIDTAMGRLHKRTFSKEETLGHIARLGLRNVEARDYVDAESDPKERETIEQLESVIGMLTERAQGLDGRTDLVERGAELLERVREVGARREPLILITAEK